MAETISKALPYMRRHNDATFVVKYGGHAMTDPKLGDLVARDVVLMKQVGMNPIVVHGGGPQINKMLERVGLKSTFVNGLRVTDAATMEIVEMVLAGSINKAIVADINECGGIAVGICGKDGNLILARKVTEMRDPKTGELLEGRPQAGRRARQDQRHGARAAAPRRRHPGGGADRLRRRRRAHLQHQCRHLGRRHRRRHAGQAAAVPDRRAGRARQGRPAHRAR